MVVVNPVQDTIGASVSVMVTLKLHSDVFPEASVATNLLVVVPTGNIEPLGRPST